MLYSAIPNSSQAAASTAAAINLMRECMLENCYRLRLYAADDDDDRYDTMIAV